MGDPLSITATMLAVVTSAIQVTKSLTETIKRYKSRDKTLQRLQSELEDLLTILAKLSDASTLDDSITPLLKSPVSRCTQVCREFEESMNSFRSKSKAAFLDWTKMEFMRGSITEFMDSIMGYKSTIGVALGIITLSKSEASHELLKQYNEIILDTTYNLNLQMQRIDDKLARIGGESSKISNSDIDLKDERAVTKQCIRICEDAQSYLETLEAKEPTLRQKILLQSEKDNEGLFEAQRLTSKALDVNRDSFAEIIGRMRERFESLPDEDPTYDREKKRLQEEIRVSKECLEVCKQASNAVYQRKEYRIGEIIAEGGSDQVMINTLADLFDVRKALSKDKSTQFFGSMTDETAQKISRDRYMTGFGTTPGSAAEANVPSTATDEPESRGYSSEQPSKSSKYPGADIRRSRPNEIRKRTPEGDGQW